MRLGDIEVEIKKTIRYDASPTIIEGGVMKTKIAILIAATFVSLFAAADPTSTVNVKNITWCAADYFGHHKIMPALTFFSFYENKDNQLTYYSTIAPNRGGSAAIGNNPYVSPTQPAIILGFSPDPNYTLGMLISNVPPPGVYVYRWLDGNNCNEIHPCLMWSMENPCN